MNAPIFSHLNIMDRSILPALAFTTMLSSAFASDRVVSVTGTYNTISSAVAASADGDRILIAAGTYNEFVHLSRSISLLPLVEGERFQLTQTLTVGQANGSTILISGMKGTYLQLVGTYTSPTTLRIVDSYFQGCQLSAPNFRVELLRDTIQQSIQISSGLVVGCSITGGVGGTYHLSVIGNNQSPDDLLIIGNTFGSVSGDGDLFLSTNDRIRMENNFIRSQRSPIVDVIRTGPVLGGASVFLNNTVHTTIIDGGGSFICGFMGAYPQNIIVKNNAIMNYNGGFLGPLPFNAAVVQSHNMIAPPSSIDIGTGEPVIGSAFIDAGDPDPRYLDLDLTRNDVGCYGGSNNRANFTTPMGSAVVGFMYAPRVVAQGEPVNITATGFDR